jgi:hypothetical protein
MYLRSGNELLITQDRVVVGRIINHYGVPLSWRFSHNLHVSFVQMLIWDNATTFNAPEHPVHLVRCLSIAV